MGDGHAGEDSPMVRPIRPGKVVPGGYSLSSACTEPGIAVVAKVDAASKDVLLSSRSRRLIPVRTFEFPSVTSLPMILLLLHNATCVCPRRFSRVFRIHSL